jgi:Fe(3+) dicitrate transport protein
MIGFDLRYQPKVMKGIQSPTISVTSLLLCLVCSILSITSLAQNGKITGVITDSDSTTTLAGVVVYLDGTQHGTATNGQGKFTINDIPAGDYLLTTQILGYVSAKKNITLRSNETLNLNLTLTEDIALMQEVVVMTRGQVGLKDIPGSVQYISAKEIQKFGYTDINRMLAAAPGVNVQEEDGFGLRPNIGLRGTGVERSSKITIMEDGVLMAPAPYSDPAAYYFPTVGRMQAIEIFKGGSQIKYGPFTTGGAINLVSTQIPNSFSGRLHLLGGSFGGRNLHAYVGNAHEQIGYMVETFQYSSDGFKNLDGGGPAGFDKSDYVAKVSINTKKSRLVQQSLTFKVGQTNETSNETYLGLTQEDFDANPLRRYSASQKDLMTNSHTQFSATHTIRLSKFLNIATTAYRSDFERNWYKLESVTDSTGAKTAIASLLDNPAAYHDALDIVKGTTSAGAGALTLRSNNRQYYAQGIQTMFGFNFRTGELTHKADVGVRYHQDEIDRFQWDDVYEMNNGDMMLSQAGVPGTESNRVGNASALASFIQYKLNWKKITVTPGLRYENITMKLKDYGKNDIERTGVAMTEKSNHVEVFIPGFGIDYQFNRFLSVFGGVHKGFSPPGPQDETKPEESINYESGVRYSKNGISLQAVLFYNDYSNLLGSDLAAAGGAGTGDLFNAGEVETQGAEFNLTAYPFDALVEKSFAIPFTIAYTYTDATFSNTFKSANADWGTVDAGDHFPYLANHQFTLTTGIEHHKFTINISGRYMDEMRTLPGQGDIPTHEKTDSYFVIDASAQYLMHKNISLFASANNITNETYVVARRPAGLRPGMPQSFQAGLKVNF